jgi:hypothetical protein
MDARVKPAHDAERESEPPNENPGITPGFSFVY